MPNTLNLYGNAFVSTGDKKFGSSSLRLKGSGDFLQAEVTNDFNLADSNYCVEGFFNFSEIKTGKNILVSKEDATNYDYTLYYDGTSSGIFWDVNGLSSSVSGSAALNVGQWYHIAATRENNHHYLWLDLNSFSAVSGSINVGSTTNDKFMIGHSVDPLNVTKTITINGDTFALTTRKYKHGYGQDAVSSANKNINDEIGNNWGLASWEDFKNFSESELESLLQAFGVDTSTSSDNWVGWLTNSETLNHFSSSKESRNFNRCYFLAFHNKSSQSTFEYFDDYHSKYCALGSWISELPYIVKKVSEPTQVSKGYQDFNGYVDGFRISKDSFRYCSDCFGNDAITSFFSNDPFTSLLLNFEGTHSSTSVIDLSSTDITINRPSIEINSVYPITGSRNDLIRVSGRALNAVSHIHLSGRNGEKLYVPKEGSLSASVNTNYSKFSCYGSTGIYFRLPESVKDNEYFTIVNVNNITDSSDTNIVFEKDVHDVRFRIGNPRINSFSPSSAAYQETVNIAGTRIDGDTKFFFRGYPTGASSTQVIYVEPLQTTVLSYTGATITVPREIISDSIYISGNGEISESAEAFTPLPTISGFEPPNLTIGSTYRVTGINATEAFPLLFITGTSSDLFYSNNGVNKVKTACVSKADLFDLESYNQQQTFLALPASPNLSTNFDNSLMGDSKLFYSGGCSILTGTITRQFVGTGNLFLSNYEDEAVRDFLRSAVSSDSLSVSSYLSSVTGESVVIKEVAPSGSFSLYPNKGDTSTLVGLTGYYMLNVTGMEVRDVNAGTKCSIPKSDFNNTKNRVDPVTFNEEESGVYRIVTETPSLNSYHQKHIIDFYPCNLSSGNSGEIYLLTPNYEVKVT